MVLPAFYRLAVEGLLPQDWLLVGNGRGQLTHLDFHDHVHQVLEQFGPAPQGRDWTQFKERLRFAGGGFRKTDPGSLLDVLAEARADVGEDAQLVHYLAVPPVAFAGLTEALGEHGLTENARAGLPEPLGDHGLPEIPRPVYEKQFGTSPDSFEELDKTVHRVLDEEQVF